MPGPAPLSPHVCPLSGKYFSHMRSFNAGQTHLPEEGICGLGQVSLWLDVLSHVWFRYLFPKEEPISLTVELSGILLKEWLYLTLLELPLFDGLKRQETYGRRDTVLMESFP